MKKRIVELANEEREREVVLCESYRLLAQEIAEKSCVLLKNNAVLPLQMNVMIALIGPLAISGGILGVWSWKGRIEDTVTLAQALETKIDVGQVTVAEDRGVTDK